ncbi:hypothetical protein HBI70_099560 [Parastagonospora nodorum]|nr:hypothetical protein HBH46_137720 [Parastagonospora nodorum]KAH4819662.1 hypothetical protein HBH61_026790 [Parastagonospora nodorum]KAH5062044.1 hypothetical protein HBH96_065960 [Parastagonospora nodorum]KAH5275628.1 hypothetical protein HBI70_099560 [Parastagonospora nodorum]KAH5453530.1 hypothetical protein HBI30_104180 [Parastagonospora nodorum]
MSTSRPPSGMEEIGSTDGIALSRLHSAGLLRDLSDVGDPQPATNTPSDNDIARANIILKELIQQSPTSNSFVANIGKAPGDVWTSTVNQQTNMLAKLNADLAMILAPERFNGDAAKVRNFVTDLRLKLLIDGDMFVDRYGVQSEQSKLAFAVSLLDGDAKKQVIPYINATMINLSNTEELIYILTNAYDDSDRINFDGTGDAFSLYSSRALADELYNCLSGELKDLFVHEDCETDYDAFKKQLLQKDARIRARAADRYSSFNKNTKGKGKGATNTPGNSSSTPHILVVLARTPPAPAGDPIDLSAVRGKFQKLTETERAQFFKEGRCFYCRELTVPLYRAAAYPKKPAARVQAVTGPTEDSENDSPSN